MGSPFNSTPATDSPCEMLPRLRTALYQLMSGQTRAQTRDGDRWAQWHPGNVKELRAEIRKLETICGTGEPRAVRAGPYYR